MKRKILIFFITLLIGITCVKAASVDYLNVSDEKDLEACFNRDNLCKLTADIALTSSKSISNQVVLDLNGHVIAPDAKLNLTTGLISVERGGKLTIDDSKGNGKITSGDNIYAAIQMLAKNDTGTTQAELVVNGGTLEGYYYGITGNGNRDNTKVTINGGTIKTLNDDSVGIFEPQTGEVIVNGGSIQGGTGIEIRAGSLTVNGGTIKGTSTFTKTPNGSGTTTTGVGITVAQHVTKKPINVNITNGDISGQYAFYEWNPQKNTKEELNKISLSINGGDFKTTLTDGLAVYSEDFVGFIHGGKFNSDVSKYLASGAQTTAKIIDGVQTEKKGHGILYGIIIVITFVAGYLLYKQYKFKLK